MVAGIIGPQTAHDIDTRIGRFIDDGTWTMPPGKYKTLVVLDGSWVLGAKRTISALRKGITAYIEYDECLRPHRYSLKKRFGTILLQRGLLLARLGNQERTWHKKLTQSFFNSLKPLPSSFDPEFPVCLINASLAAGGAERQLVNTVLGLRDKKIKTEVVCRHYDTSVHKFYEHMLVGKIPFYKMPFFNEMIILHSEEERQKLRADLNYVGIERIRKAIPNHIFQEILSYFIFLRKMKPKVVHLWQDQTNVLGGLAAYLAGVPKVIMGTRNMAPYNFKYFQGYMEPIYRFLTQRPNFVLLNNSNAGACEYEEWLELEARHIHRLYNGVSPFAPPTNEAVTLWAKKHAIPKGKRVVGSIMRFYEEKDPQLWINTAIALADKVDGVVFLLIGEGPMRQEIESAAMKAGLADKLLMPGEFKDVRFPLACMDAFLLTSKFEGTPNVLIEAQMMGVPVVTTPAGGAPETVLHGKTGFVSQKRDPSELANLLATIINSQDASSFSNEAKRFAKERFGLERMLDESCALYETEGDVCVE
jgi:glycosyltransferase involved in cell wall biosynthesis